MNIFKHKTTLNNLFIVSYSFPTMFNISLISARILPSLQYLKLPFPGMSFQKLFQKNIDSYVKVWICA